MDSAGEWGSIVKAFVEFVTGDGARVVIRRSSITEVQDGGTYNGRPAALVLASGQYSLIQGTVGEVLEKIGWCPTCAAGPGGCSNDEVNWQ